MDLLKRLVRETSVCLLILVLLSCETLAADDKDKQECTEALVGLATCLPYVGGTAKAPTPDCCTGLKQVLNTNKKCLCFVIKDRNDPDLGLTINVTLALGLPTVCNAPADVTKCPALLHLDPNSTDAQVFYQNGHKASRTASSPAPSVNSNLTRIRGSGGGDTVPLGGSSSGTGTRKRSLTREVIVTGVLLSFFTSNLII